MECMKMDVKMVWMPNVGKNAYLLSVIDVHTRRLLKDYFSFNIKQNHVIAKNVREYLSIIGVQQEFTHVATPEEIAHIEAYHGILKKEVFTRFEYNNFGQIQQILKRFVHFYNNERLHGLLGKITPMEKWNKDKHLILKKDLVA